jgi:hypothetical protein
MPSDLGYGLVRASGESRQRNDYTDEEMERAKRRLIDIGKGAASAPFTWAPDLMGMIMKGAAQIPSISAGGRVPELSGDPIRQSVFNLDPRSGYGIIGEFLDPTNAMFKVPSLATKLIKGTPLVAGMLPAVVKGKKPRNLLRATHWSKKKGLKEIDPGFYGTGGAGAEKKLKEQFPEYWVDKSYYGLNVDEAGGYRRESMLGSERYDVLLNKGELYDIRKDPLGLRETIPKDLPEGARLGFYEQAIRDAGFKGYEIDNTVAMFDKVPTEVPLLGRFEETTPARIRNTTRADDGYTVNLQTGELPEEGLLVGMRANNDPRVMVLDKTIEKPTGEIISGLTANDIVEFARINKLALDNPNNFMGTWLDRETGKTYLETSKRYRADKPDAVRQATKAGEKTGQIAIWDAAAKEALPVGSWRQFIESPEFFERMSIMEDVGSNYLKQHPTDEWWDIHGTIFEKIYGKENLDVLAGFIASTAPNRDPTANLRTMTEYMRRFLIGEPIIQPHWRVPEGTVSRNAGTRIGMENTFIKNLLRASEGRVGDLQQNKVREEALALLGDPNAAVFDRHWARLSEDPSRGIYAASREGTINPGEDYAAIKDVVGHAAAAEGRPVRDYSADVWTGIRETIKNKHELFGQKFRGSAIRGESKGYADLFSDLIAEKAEALGITFEEMSDRLSKGDAELLSLVLAAPLGAWAYREYQNEAASNDSS